MIERNNMEENRYEDISEKDKQKLKEYRKIL